jgi:hypothetical protein
MYYLLVTTRCLNDYKLLMHCQHEAPIEVTEYRYLLIPMLLLVQLLAVVLMRHHKANTSLLQLHARRRRRRRHRHHHVILLVHRHRHPLRPPRPRHEMV